jgi:hypothetical protein
MQSCRLPALRLGIAVVLAGCGAQAATAKAPHLLELRLQRAHGVTYFHVRFETPRDMRTYGIEQWQGSDLQRRKLSRLPLMVPQDGMAGAVHLRIDIPDYRPAVGFDAEPTRPPVPVQGFEFVGKVLGDLQANDRAKFLLLYPIDLTLQPPTVPDRDCPAAQPSSWVECEVELHFGGGVHLGPPEESKRSLRRPPARDDLEGLWAAAQAGQLAILEALTPDFGFFGFACEATSRKYGVRAPMLERGRIGDREQVHRRLYETTTGSTAITESLQLHRLLNPGYRDKDQRTVDVGRVPGIDIAEHPWEKMIGDDKPSPEPLARLVPHDNFYVHFKSIRKFNEFGELLDKWGTNLVRAYEINSRDYDLKGRYEKQLCLRSSWLGKTFGPAVVKSMALTGNDGYLREGSDLTVLFHVNDRKLFLTAVDKFINEARRELGAQLSETRSVYHDISVESFVTPLREVSAHRAVFGDFIVYSNSPVALRRVIDAHQGRLKSISDSLDFQYMRTVFRLEDDLEDGFAFLPDAFIRQLVGPRSKIKEKRRLEALTSLQMVTHAAMFSAWETGKLPADHDALLAASILKPPEIYTPEGNGVAWDAARQTAISDFYNTMHFPTPLVELPIDKITPGEEQEYRRFREEYLNLWRKYFDPVGMRVSLNKQRVRLQTYILPLLRHSEYDSLRQFAGGGTALLDPARFSSKTLIQGTVHLSPSIKRFIPGNSDIGNWAMIRVDDSTAFSRLANLWIRQEFDPKPNQSLEADAIQVLEHFPVTVGIQVKDPKAFLKTSENLLFGGTIKEDLKPYQGVVFTRLQWNQGPPNTAYYAVIDDAWYLSLKEDSLKDLVDQWVARRDGKEPAATREKPVPINGSVYLAPAAAVKAGDALRFYLDWESQRRALVNCPMWYALYRCGLVAENDPGASKRTAAMRYFGFVPVSPDGSAYTLDAKTGEVLNRRYGSPRRPQCPHGVKADSPLEQLLDQFRTFRADLRFQEDGINTTVTIQRK